MPKKSSKQEAAEKFVADLEDRITWKCEHQVDVDDHAVRHVNRTLETAHWIASQRLGFKAGESPEIVLAVYDRTTARAKFLMSSFPGPATETPKTPEAIQEQSPPSAL